MFLKQKWQEFVARSDLQEMLKDVLYKEEKLHSSETQIYIIKEEHQRKNK